MLLVLRRLKHSNTILGENSKGGDCPKTIRGENSTITDSEPRHHASTSLKAFSNFKSDTFHSDTSCTTAIDGSVRDLPTAPKLSDSLRRTFNNEQYRTTVATEDIVLYRVYGGASKKEGAFLTSEKPNDSMDIKMGLALKAEWKNSRENYCEVIVPKGSILHIGKAAPQITESGYVLPGGMDQIVISKEFVAEHPQAFGIPQELGLKTGYKEFEKKVQEIEAQIKKENKDFVEAILRETTTHTEALKEFTESFSSLADSINAYTEVCWLPKEDELPLAMAKADVFSSGLHTALISICLVAKVVKDKINE